MGRDQKVTATRQTFYVPTAGTWSGGGRGVLSNYRHAASRHSMLSFEEGEIDVVNRNYPNTGWRRPFVLAPQNAWPWDGPTSGLPERAKVTALRTLSEVAMQRAVGIIRVGGSIPPRRKTAGLLLPNPLDPDFETAVCGVASSAPPSADPYLVSIGSLNSYRGIEDLIGGYRLYRLLGGALPLRVIGSGPSNYVERLATAMEGTPGLSISTEAVARHDCLVLVHHAAGVILPSHVEASPFSLLEALAVQHHVIASDITGHRDIVPEQVPEPRWFQHLSPKSLAEAMLATTPTVGFPTTPIASPDWREGLRNRWGEHLVSILSTISEGTS